MAESQYAQQRRHPRLAEAIPAQVQLFGRRQSLAVSIVTLSAGGAALVVPIPVRVNSTLAWLRFALPAIRQQPGTVIAVPAIVRWTRDEDPADREGRYVIGVQFLDLDEKAFERVQRYVYYRLLDAPGGLPVEPPTHRRQPELETPLTLFLSA
jgi:c-di-GMP-binding flagellar brake protein YcgR